MTGPAAHKTLGSELQITIATTLTEIPFLDNIELDVGENKHHELLGVNMDYATPIPTGVRGMGTITADVLAYDPTDAVHQAVAAAFNNQTEVEGAIVIGATSETLLVKYLIKKFPVSLGAAAVVMSKMECDITEIVELPAGA